MSENYWTTAVPVARSADEIRKLLAAFGADRFALSEDWEHGRLAVQFSYKGFPVEFGVDVDLVAGERLRSEPWSNKRRKSKADYEHGIKEKAARVAMRILSHHLKASLIAVKYGLVSFEDVFLAKFLTRNGQTVGDIVVPRLAEVIVQPGRLLTGGKT